MVLHARLTKNWMQLVERYMYAMLMTNQQYFYMAKTPRRAFHNVVILAGFVDLSYCGFTTCQLNALKKVGTKHGLHFALKDILFELLCWMFKIALYTWLIFWMQIFCYGVANHLYYLQHIFCLMIWLKNMLLHRFSSQQISSYT